jgi:hypothetical protein
MLRHSGLVAIRIHRAGWIRIRDEVRCGLGAESREPPGARPLQAPCAVTVAAGSHVAYRATGSLLGSDTQGVAAWRSTMASNQPTRPIDFIFAPSPFTGNEADRTGPCGSSTGDHGNRTSR